MAIRFNHKPGLVVYLTAGDPSLDATLAIALAAIDAGADVIELGVPFSDPLADGPVIQRASERAVARGTRLKDVLALAAAIRAARPNAGLVIFTYFNPIVRYGLARFVDDAAAAGADGVLVTDLIVEEAGAYLAAMERVNLAPIFLAAPTSPDERLEAIATHSKGFIYAISRVGITGKQQSLTSDAASLVARIRRWSTLPVAVGFGISCAEHVAQVAEFADAAVIGSAIVELIERSTPEAAPGAVARFIKGLRLSATAEGAGPANDKAPQAALASL
ncbi:MAG TPA: tryptophan synthase subunit alpha [Terracidiphilus sp.]|jgi:tryptophan synthase alpha chain|nr:tryptophan synthase subunit alpha [Terracidiphilus sp.]